MIKLTNEFDNPLWVFPNHIEFMEIAEYDKEKNLGIRIHLSSGKEIVVRECFNQINKLIQELS